MKRREFIKTSAVGTAAGLALGPNLLRAQDARPNVLLVLVDQMRQPRWTPPGITPNVDRLAKRGVSFTNHFVSAVPCSPSRACLMTGTYTTQNKMFTNCDFVEGALQPSLDPKIPTMGHIFKKAGYRTPYRGKWHLTRRADRHHGDPLIEYGFEGWKPPEAPFGGPPYNGALVDPVYAREAVAWITGSESKKQPWSLVCSLVNPHDICAYPRYYPHTKLSSIKTERPPDNWTDDLSGKPGAQLEHQKKYNSVGGPLDVSNPDAWRRYLDYYIHCQGAVDRCIGSVLDALDRSGQLNNTIVVFTADHGEMAGSHRLRTKGCFAYEEVMNVPLIFAWPGALKEGVTTGAFASNVDVMPTLAAMAGLSGLPYMAGLDLTPALKQPDSGTVRDHILYHTDWEVALTVGKKAGEHSIYGAPAHIRSIRDADWKYALYFRPGSEDVEHELYDLKNDPLEMTNLANDSGYLKKRGEMHDRLMEREKKLLAEYSQ